MFVEGDTYPGEYIPYLEKYTLEWVSLSVKETDAEFLTADEVQNLYNPEDPDILVGKSIHYNGGTISDRADMNVSGFIPVTAGQTYSFPVYNNVFGDSTVSYIAFYDENKEYLSGIGGTLYTE